MRRVLNTEVERNSNLTIYIYIYIGSKYIGYGSKMYFTFCLARPSYWTAIKLETTPKSGPSKKQSTIFQNCLLVYSEKV